ncbi:PilW family protein [Arhodomonas sp. SL1]|uniref:PilW family protein n=1 Tax=Arhodomonas sp. SL1 TaxID=3425691 RepID=UPI003F8832D8
MRTKDWKPQRGVTLVELMISLLIGSILVLGIVSLFAASRQTQDTQQHMSRLAEDVRFFSEFIARDIRMAGYGGACGPPTTPMEWDENALELTLRYCDDDSGNVKTVTYDFDNNDREVSYSEDDGAAEELLRGIELRNGEMWFGIAEDDGELEYEDEFDSGAFDEVRSVRLPFTLLGALEADTNLNDLPDDRDAPEFELTVAIRNNTLRPLSNHSGE